VLPNKDVKLPIDYLRALDAKVTLSLISAYRAQPPNMQKEAVIQFAIRLAASFCRGTDRPTINDIHDFIKSVGEFYTDYISQHKPTLQNFFSNQALFSNHVEGNIDQTIESIWKNYQKHDKFLEAKLGFNVANAIFFTNSILALVTIKLCKSKGPKDKKLSKRDFYNLAFFVQPDEKTRACWSNAIIFTLEEITNALPNHLTAKLQKYIEFVSIPLEKIPQTTNPLDPDPLLLKPMVKINDQYLIPTPYYLLHGLSDRLQAEIAKDFKYHGRFGNEKGHVFEERTHEELRQLFKNGKIFKNIIYESSGSLPDSDIIVNYEEYLFFVECTSKNICNLSKQGNAASVNETLKDSIKKCYLQAKRAKKAYLDGRIKLQLDRQPSKFVLMVVTDLLYPNLLSEYIMAQHYKKRSYLSDLVTDGEYPYIISISDLQSIRCLSDEATFIRFVEERLNMYRQPYFLAQDEFDYFILFNKPEYEEIKEKILKVQTVLDYVAHIQSPLAKTRTFYEILETIGSEDFAVFKIGKRYDRALASIGFSLLYDIYCDWSLTLEHFVFDIKGFNAIILEHQKKGTTCRAIVWEGLYEYLDFCRLIGHKEEAKLIEQKLKECSLKKEPNALIVIPTDIYEGPSKEFKALKKELAKQKKRGIAERLTN